VAPGLGIEVAVAVHEAKVHLAALHDGTYDIAFATTLLDVADATAALEDFTSDAFPIIFPTGARPISIAS